MADQRVFSTPTWTRSVRTQNKQTTFAFLFFQNGRSLDRRTWPLLEHEKVQKSTRGSLAIGKLR